MPEEEREEITVKQLALNVRYWLCENSESRTPQRKPTSPEARGATISVLGRDQAPSI